MSFQGKSELVFSKVIYNYKSKSTAQVKTALELEVDYLTRTNPGYELKSFSKPMFNADGSTTYQITFTKKVENKEGRSIDFTDF